MIAAAMPSKTGFAVRLRALREQAGLTQEQLAEKADVAQQTLAKLEQGGRDPVWTTVLKLAEALGVEVTAFVAPEGETPAELPKRPRGRPKKPGAGESGEVQ